MLCEFVLVRFKYSVSFLSFLQKFTCSVYIYKASYTHFIVQKYIRFNCRSIVALHFFFHTIFFFSVLFNYEAKLSTQNGKLENRVFEYQL